ncbi:MAG TPA: ABC transporter permease [Streptosporangiales bacterium]
MTNPYVDSGAGASGTGGGTAVVLTPESAAAAGPGAPGPGKPRSLAGDAWRDLRRNPVFLVACLVLLVIISMAVVPQLWTHVDPHNCDLKFARGGSRPGHPFGFDEQGCDLYAHVIYGARPSIAIGLLATGVSSLIAIILGSISAFYGGATDAVIQRINDVFFGFPTLLGSLLVLTRLDIHNVWSVSFTLVVFGGWTTLTRVMRGSVLGSKSADYVMAARALGASSMRVMFRHILPNAVMPVLVLATLNVGAVIGAEGSLSFLGIGLQYPTISWGVQLSTAQQFFFEAPHLLVFPALFLSVTVLTFILIGDAVRDAFDPKLR